MEITKRGRRRVDVEERRGEERGDRKRGEG